MEERSTANFDNNDDDNVDVGGQIEGYKDLSPSSSSSQGTSSKSRHQRKDGDDQLDDDDFDRILSRSAAQRLLALFEGTQRSPLIAAWLKSDALRHVFANFCFSLFLFQFQPNIAFCVPYLVACRDI